MTHAGWTTFGTRDGGWNPRGRFPIHKVTVFDFNTKQVAAVSWGRPTWTYS